MRFAQGCETRNALWIELDPTNARLCGGQKGNWLILPPSTIVAANAYGKVEGMTTAATRIIEGDSDFN